MRQDKAKGIDSSRVALVHDALPFIGGAERVLLAVMEVFPDSPVYTLVRDPEKLKGTPFEGRQIHTSFIDYLPLARKAHRYFLPLYPKAVERFDFSPFEVVLSFSYAAVHGICTRPDQLHISYKYTPLRQAWQGRQEVLDQPVMRSRLKSWASRRILDAFKKWDLTASRRPDVMIAPSRWIAACIHSAYQRDAAVIYPPVDTEGFQPLPNRREEYIAVSRLEPHKRVDLILEAFARLGYPLAVVGDGSQRAALEAVAPANVRFVGSISDSALREQLGSAKALVHAAIDDFGIALVEAQAAGCPVIALGKGGACETVLPDVTGLLFPEQNSGSLADAVRRFESGQVHFNRETVRRNALRFDKSRFQEEYLDFVKRALVNAGYRRWRPGKSVPSSGG